MYEDIANSMDMSPREYFIAHPRRKLRLILDELHNIGASNHNGVYGLGPRRRNTISLREDILEYIFQQLAEQYQTLPQEELDNDDFDIF